MNFDTITTMAEVYRINGTGQRQYAGYRIVNADGTVRYGGGGTGGSYGNSLRTAAARSSRNNPLSRLQRRLRG